MVHLDPKGRMAIPARYRQTVQEDSNNQLVATIDPESLCLLLYPLSEWEEIERKLEALPSFNPASRRIQRLLMGHASELELDAQGRVLIPPLLRDYARLEKSVVLVGQGKKFELWGEDEWEKGRTVWLSESSSLRAEGLPEELQHISL